MHNIIWKNNSFQSSDVSILRHRCGVSTYPQFYYRIYQIFQKFSHPYQNSYDGKNGNKILK